ncbi:hypothetical protein ES707_16638 [subsurface metagenome]
MKLLFRTVLLVFLVSLALPLGVAQAAPPLMPQPFYGEVTIGDVLAPDGTTVSAEIDDFEYASTTTSGGEYLLEIPGEIPDEPGKQGGEPGDTVVFKVNSIVADSDPAGPITFDPGRPTELDLAIVGEIYTLTMAVNGSGTTAPLAGDHDYIAGTVVDISATEDAGWQFDSWTGAVADPSSASTTVIMDSAKTVTATFTFIEIGELAVTTNAATSIGTTTATLDGSLTGLGDASSVEVSFEWGKTTGYGSETGVKTMTSTGSFSATLSGLSSSTTYHFRAKGDTSYGDDRTFTTKTPSGDGGAYTPPPAPTIDTDLFGTEGSFETDSDGKIQETIEATSEDGNLTITIPKDTVALDIEGEPLDTLEVAVDESPPDPPEDAHVIGLAYDFGPNGATFDPAITLEYTYDPDALPEGVDDLVLAYYDEATGEWVELDCVVDTENNTITASVAHFTTFAIIGRVTVVAPPEPAAFSVSSLSIQPAEVEPDETVTIAVSVANTGGESGSYTVVLKIDGVKEDEERVTVAAGSSKTVSFSVTKEEAGSYTVTVDGRSGSFTVVTVVVAPEPAAFSVSYLSFSPLEVEPGEAVTITMLVANIGGESGSYAVVLKIDGVKEAEESVTIAAGESQNVSFSVTKEDPGDYTVAVDGLSDSFTVVAPEEEAKPGINWALIGGIIGGLIVVAGLLYYFLVFRRRAY